MEQPIYRRVGAPLSPGTPAHPRNHESRLNTTLSWFRAAPRPLCVRAALLLAVTALLLGRVNVAPSSPATPVSPCHDERTAADMNVAGPIGSPLTLRDKLLGRLGVDRWLQAGQRGRGLKVAILDSGFRDYRNFLGKALPAAVTAKSFREDGDLEARDSQHGILCGEVVHAAG